VVKFSEVKRSEAKREGLVVAVIDAVVAAAVLEVIALLCLQ
jgi:hypothetical protein